MTDHAPSPHERYSLRFTFGALWRVVVILSLVWAVGGSLDGAAPEELIGVPLVMAVWALGIFILDRWVVEAFKTSGPSAGIPWRRSCISWRVVPMVVRFDPKGDHGEHGAK